MQFAALERTRHVLACVSWLFLCLCCVIGSLTGATEPGDLVNRHWSFQPIRDVPLPQVKDEAWLKTSIDSFIRSSQEAAGIRPAHCADKLSLIRRATFDLTGLPPMPQEVDAFLADTSPRAFGTVVDRLLDSPAYGECWGRHWLDIVRYADTAGETADYPVPQAWRYRNYVIEAFNADKPYGEFLREQIAGDVLAEREAATRKTSERLQDNPDTQARDRYAGRVIATGYLAILRRFGFDSENYHHLTIQDTIDTLGQTVLGLSLGCARCHDHKFDPVSMHDYYALYGIFDSSRYSFPGSEQKQKMRSLAPLIPTSESRQKWREYESRVGGLSGTLARSKQPVPAAVLRSLHDCDGDFELQAAAAGGSKGVLVPPWLYEGNIAVTSAAQSPFKNLYPTGRVGISLPADGGKYRIAQAIYPRRTSENCQMLHANLDFRVAVPAANTQGAHRFTLGAIGKVPAVEVLIACDSISLRVGETVDRVSAVKPSEWHNLQLDLDLNRRTISGRVGAPGSVTEFTAGPCFSGWSGGIDFVVIESCDGSGAKTPAIDFDNFAIQEIPIPPVSVELPGAALAANEPDTAVLVDRLQAITGIDGDFELQTKDTSPASPWNPGPNSVVRLSTDSQSPFRNIYPPGELGMHLPNRGEYDGFGLALRNVKPNGDGRLCASFDFRCASNDAGGNGSWRYYLGHGPGQSAAVELFFNDREFFQRSADMKRPVGPLAIGDWYQVQLVLDLKAKTYSGLIISRTGDTQFRGELASGWDGVIDYTFIDSYGHIGGVRPALDADNFYFSDNELPARDAPPVSIAEGTTEPRRAQVGVIRKQLAAIQARADEAKHELDKLLADGPFESCYGMSEGTPHNARMQLRGEPDQPGIEVPRGFIKALGGSALPGETIGSGRLELANWLTRPDNPLLARVMVNRIWQYHFASGLVKTPNDFGVRGLPPTHPDLLDHLATQFIRSGWSIKAMHRLIMLSATYQQSSIVTDENRSTDGLNTSDWYASFARRRLSAEEIRDSILAVSGELDPIPGREHPFPAPTGWGFTQHAPFNAVYDHDKRSVYLMTQRLKRHPFLALFDGADPNATSADRLMTTVPTQALFFLNDPIVHAKAEKWAARLESEQSDDQQRIVRAYRQALGRPATPAECAEAVEFLAVYRTELAAEKVDHAGSRSLAAFLRTLFASNEFLYVD